jgi:putative membrane protein
MMWGYGGGWGWVMAVAMLGVVILLAVAVALLFAVVGRSQRGAPSHPGRTSWGYPPSTEAERELEMRFARGEIDADALARGRAALRGGTPPGSAG